MIEQRLQFPNPLQFWGKHSQITTSSDDQTANAQRFSLKESRSCVSTRRVTYVTLSINYQ